MTNLAGLHDREAAAIARPDTWILDTVALSGNPQATNYAAGLHWITRLNWGYGSTGTLPRNNLYGEYASRAAGYVLASQGCHRWIIGNEPNLSREWPENQPISPWQYSDCYGMTREYIHDLPGHENDEVLIAAPGPWNAELKYEGNPNGDWIQNFADVIKACGNEIDGFSLHGYTHGYNVALVTSSARMQAPFQNRHYEFRAYRDYMEAIPDELSHLPCYITEANGNGPWQAVGIMPAMLGEIDAWNQASKQKIYAVIFYRYPKYDDFYIEGRSDVISEYHAAVARGYTSPVKGKEQMDTHIPVVSPGTSNAEPSLPPRQFDERLTARGVTIETPPLKPGQQFWRIVKAQWWNEQEAQGRHHIYIEAPDRTAWRVVWPSGSHPGYANGKSGFDASNYPMSKSLNEFSVQVRGDMDIVSETLKGIGMGDKGNSGIHTSTGVVFQLATVPTQPPSPGPQPQPPVKPVEPTPSIPTGIIEPRVAQAILKVESGGRTHGEDGRIIIRFEAHIFKTYLKNDALWAQHFSANAQRPWMNQQWRADPNGAWLPIHTGKQADEWAAFEFANNQLSTPASFMAISMGAAQIMGFNFARIGYPSAADMYAAFRDPLVQTIGFINFFLSDPALADAMRRKDWREIAKRYNGSGAIDTYAPLLEKAYKELGGS